MTINKIGIELEGEFFDDLDYSEYKEGLQAAGWHVKDDGSLRSSNGGYCYELVSDAVTVGEVDALIKALEPIEQGGKFSYANSSAGTHIHISLADGEDYEMIRSYGFYKQFVKAYNGRFTLTKYSSRFSNRYCEQYAREKEFVRYTGEQQRATSRTDTRYKAINYCKEYHGTIEFRLFPYVVTRDGLKEIIDFVVELVKNYKPDPTGLDLLNEWRKHDFLVIPEKRNVTYELWKDLIGDYTGAYQLGDGHIQLSKEALSVDLIQLLNKTTVIKFENDK